MTETDDKPLLEKVIPDESVQFQLDGTAERLTDWKNEPGILLLKGDLEQAKQSHDSQIAKIKKWQDLLAVTGSAKPPKIKGRSSVQPKLIRRQAEWRYSAISEPFLSSDKLFKVDPVSFEDAEAARQNELVINYQARTKLNRVKLIDDLVRATVDEGTCILRTGWKRCTKRVKTEVPIYEYFKIQNEQELQTLQQAMETRTADPRTFEEQSPPELKAALEYLDETGDPVIAVQNGTKVVEEEVVYENHPTVDVLNPDNFYPDPSCNGDLDRALFAVVSFETNKAELLKDGDRYKNLGKVNWENSTTVAEPDHVTDTPDTFQFRDAPRKKVVAWEYWGFFDVDGNGSLTPIVATWIGDTIIRLEKNPFPDEKIPFVVIPYLPIKRELYGEPDAEMLEDNQKVLGAVTRGMIDLLGNSANGQKGFAKGMLDPMNRRRYENGQDYEYNPTMPTDKAVIEHKYPELPRSALEMLSLQNQEAEALTGVKSFAGGLSGDAYGNVATGIKGMLDAAAKREMSILRRVAKGVCDVGRKILAMNAEFLSDTEVVRVTNEEFVTVNRDDLRGEFDLKVDISTFEVDNSKAQDLGFMLQTLGPNMDPQVSMQILAEIAELKRMPVLAHRLRTWKPQPDPMQQKLQEMELMLKQAEIQKVQSEIQLNQAKAMQAQSTASLNGLEQVEQETGTKHVREMQRIQAQGRANQDLAITNALVKAKKPDEKGPDVQAAIGYNALSRAMEEEQTLGPKPPAIPPVNP